MNDHCQASAIDCYTVAALYFLSKEWGSNDQPSSRTFRLGVTNRTKTFDKTCEHIKVAANKPAALKFRSDRD